MQTELDKKKLESIKADLDYNLRASEYNVEILKNQIENLNTEMGLLKNKNEKQKRYIQIQKSKNERVQLDLEHYKRNSKKAPKAAPKLNESMMTPRAAGKGKLGRAASCRSSIQPAKYDEQQVLDMNDSFIFKESPDKDVQMVDETRDFNKRLLRTAGSRGRKTTPFVATKP